MDDTLMLLAPPRSSRPPVPRRGWEAPRPVGAGRFHAVRAPGGATLSVYEVGDAHGPPLLFLHGFSQSHLAWWRQYHSALALGFRLLAVDLRGHGHSDKPRGDYGNGRLWAGDLQAVITSLELRRPLLVAWSWGALVVADYLRHCGQEQISGVSFVSALVNLGPGQELLSPEVRALLPRLAGAEDAPDSRAALEDFTSLLHHQPVSAEVRRMVLAYTEMVPAHVREGWGARLVDNDAVLRRLQVPVLISHGLEDRVVVPEAARRLAALLPGARTSLYAGSGHAPFWEDSHRFNRELAAFAARCW